jgi:hypothetical protein
MRGIGLIALFCCACGSDRENPSTIRDTSGATFSWTCTEDGCSASPIGAVADAPCGDFYSNAHGRFVNICVARRGNGDKVYWSTRPDLCRHVACQADEDCPQWANEAFACRSGLCQNESVRQSPSDDTGLCLDAVPRRKDCQVPPECRQP